MSMNSERIEEETTQDFCKKLAKKIEEHKENAEVTSVLKELGRQLLHELPNIPEWSYEYARLFRE